MMTPEYAVHFWWDNTSAIKANTAATVEVDVMPQLGRTPEGGPFAGYEAALSNLGANFVRFAPWYAYPKVVVAELEPTTCGKNGHFSWNTSLLDAVVSDFMIAVCGPKASEGECEGGLSVVPQLSTMPAWMYEDDGVNRTELIPEDPWQFPSHHFDYYLVKGQPLRDASCMEMARYAARLVSWYTVGGMTDVCGVWHTSNLFYKWPLLSVLNEDEYRTPPGGGLQYTTCFDAWKSEIGKVNPAVQLVGPETAGGSYGLRERAEGKHLPGAALRRTAALRGQLAYSLYFLNGSNHADGKPPPVVSNHVALYGNPQDNWRGFFQGVDEWIDHVATPLERARRRLAPSSRLVMNEFIPFVSEWCNASFVPPGSAHSPTCDWTANTSMGARMHRTTLGWNAAAASFAYGFGRLSEMAFGWVGADQLIGGVWPDNEPAVASLDWSTGEANAKFWAVRMLARRLGAAPRTLYVGSISGGPKPPAPGAMANGTCGFTNYGGDCNVQDEGAWNTTAEGIRSLAGCVARCERDCSRCAYVSFSLGHEDCSWYRRCDLARLTQTGAGYLSEAVMPVDDPAASLYALGMRLNESPGESGGAAPQGGERLVLLVSKVAHDITVTLGPAAALASAEVLEASSGVREPGFAPPVIRHADETGRLKLGSFAIAIVTLRPSHGPSKL